MKGVKGLSDEQVLEYAKDFLKRNEDGLFDIRKYADIVNVPKSTLHFHFKIRLKELNYNLWLKYLTIANRNKFLGVKKGGKSHAKILKEKKEK
jgi:hypothetical protein